MKNGMLRQIEWENYSPFENISPVFLNTENSFIIDAVNNEYSYGKWIGKINKVETEMEYTISVDCDIISEKGRGSALVTWLRNDGSMISRDYFIKYSNKMQIKMIAPSEAESFKIELGFWSLGKGTAKFGVPKIQISVPAAPKIVNAAVAYFPFPWPRTTKENLDDIIRIIDNAGNSKDKPQLLCFAETAYDREVPIPIKDKCIGEDHEVIQLIKNKAKEYGMYIVFGIHEIDKGLMYNTAFLISSDGEIAGKYRKTHLALAEIECGLTPGTDIPVFDTPLGRIGLMICWDQWFPETARFMHLQGVDIICLITAGDTKYQCRARAADSGAYVLVAGAISPESSKIINPLGEVVCHVEDLEKGFVSHKIDLSNKFYQYWLSVGEADAEGKTVYLNERREDLYAVLCRNTLLD